MNTEPTENPILLAKKKNKWVMAFTAILLLGVTLAVINYGKPEPANALTIDEDDVEAEVVSKNNTNVSVIDRLDFNFDVKDGVPVPKDDFALWEPLRQINVTIDEDEKTYWTSAKTIEELLKELEVKVQEHDKINYEVQSPIDDNMNITIEHAFPVVVEDGTEKGEKLWTTSTTVADFLTQNDIILGELDRIEPGLKENLTGEETIKIFRVEKVTDVVEETVDYAIVTKKDANLEKGTEKVVQEGKEGLLEKTFEVTKENGKEIDRKQISENKVRDAQDKIVAVGTKEIVKQASRGQSNTNATTNQQASTPATSSGDAPSGGKEMYMEATAYTAYCNGCSGLTATGIDLRSNPNLKVIAVDPSVIPLGSKVWVEGYGTAIAGDTGGAIKGNRIDLFVSSKEQAYRFGRKQVKIRIMN